MILVQAQMLDLGNFKEISEQLSNQVQDNTKFLIGLGVVILIDILLLGARIWSDFSIKSMDKGIHSANLKEQKKINLYEQIYAKMDEITNIDPRDSSLILMKVTELERFFKLNFLYIHKQVEKIIFKFTDYNKAISQNISLKNFDTEVEFVTALKDHFNKN